MSINPLPEAPQPQYLTLSPDWSALLKIGRAYRLLYHFNLIWFLLAVVFFITMAALVVIHSEDLESIFYHFHSVFKQENPMEMEVMMGFGLDPETAMETRSTGQVNSSKDWNSHMSVFAKDLWEYLKTTPFLIVSVSFFFLFLIMFLIMCVIKIIVMFRFANCPGSIVPGGHGTGLAYAICMGLSLLLTGIAVVASGEKNDYLIARIACLMTLVTFILFLFFAHKIAVAVRSQQARFWLRSLNLSIGCFCFTCFMAVCFLVPLFFGEDSELFIQGYVAFTLVLCIVGFVTWFFFLKLYQSLGRDVQRFIESAMADYSGQMDQ